MPYTINDVKKAIQLPHFDSQTAQLKMSPVFRQNKRPPGRSGQPRVGSILIMLYCLANELHLVLTRRRDDLKSHAGQISFPGGRQEPAEPLQRTALRETYEEIGIPAHHLEVLGRLTSLYILPSDFEVHPFVAWYIHDERPIFRPAATEVAEIIEVPLTHLLNPATRMEEIWQIRGYEMLIPFFAVAEHKVWGATAMMMSEFLERLRAVSNVYG